MFNKKNYKKVLISVLALMMIFGTVALAAEGIFDKKITATYGRIKFTYKGNDVTKLIENQYGTPAFTVDGRAYAPVRAMADLLGVDIDYDNNTHTVKITDSKEESYKLDLDKKNKEIEEKEKEIEELKKEVKKLKDGTVDKGDLKSLETSLNKKYGEHEKVEFDVVLKENKDNISIDINTDLRNTRDEQNWIKMKYSDKKYLMEGIVTEVRKAFPNTDITGNIYDASSRKNLYTFRQTKNGSLSITNNDYVGSSSDYRYDRYDGYVDQRVRSEFDSRGIYDAKLSRLDYSGRTAYFEIDFSSKYDREWDKSTDTQIESMLDYIVREIQDNYIDDIKGDIYMGNTLVGTYDKRDSSSGRFIRKY